MRSALILSGVAILSLTAPSAQAQTNDSSGAVNGWPPASSDPGAAGAKPAGAWAGQTNAGPAPSDAGAAQQDKAGYDAKADKKDAKSKKRATYSQTTGKTQDNGSGYQVPYGPPR